MEGQTTQPNSLRFDHTAAEINSITDSSINSWNQIIDSVIALKDPRTFANTIEPIAKFEYDYVKVAENLMFYKDMSTDKEQRDASLEVSKKFTDFAISIEMRFDFF